MARRVETWPDSLFGTFLPINTTLDIGVVYLMMFRLMNKETRNQVVEWAATNAYNRLEQKLKYPETNVHQVMHWLEQEPTDSASA
jgi:hypothetical protein